MATPGTTATAPPPRAPRRPLSVAPWVGLVLALLLVTAAVAVPRATGWDVHARNDDLSPFPPLHGFWQPGVGVGTVPALLLALLGWRHAAPLAERLTWRRLLVVSYAAGLAWLLALALVDGPSGLTRVLGSPDEYLPTARSVTSVHDLLLGYVDRIPFRSAGHWPIHVAGHPPGALLFFVGLVRIGLGGDLAAALVVTALAATTPPAVLATLRTLGAEDAARRAAPYLVLGPAAIFAAVSADALFAAVAAWGLAALAVGAVARGRARAVGWSALAGLLLGYGVTMSYGLPLIGLVAVAVLLVARSWLPLPVAAGSALLVVLAFAAGGFRLWAAYPVLHDRYWAGAAKDRPASYWLWGDLAALLLSAGPVLGVGLACLVVWRRGPAAGRARSERVVVTLAAAAAAAVLLADASQMSKAEVERIWLPFVPWLLVSTALLPERWRRPALGLQLATALLVEHLLYTTW